MMGSAMPARILVVDDFEDARDLYAEYLRTRGFEVSCAADGEAALHLALRSGYDLVVLDLALPRMDGIAVLRELRRSPQTAKTPIIILSASVGTEACQQTLDAGADLFLEKPCLPDELEKAVLGLLEARARTTKQG